MGTWHNLDRDPSFRKLAPPIIWLERTPEWMAGAAEQMDPPRVRLRMVMNQTVNMSLPNLLLFFCVSRQVHHVPRLRHTRVPHLLGKQ